MGKFSVGWSEVSLVPNKKVTLAGQFYERIAEYVKSDITATAMAVESEGKNAILFLVIWAAFLVISSNAPAKSLLQ